jgi:hypothetical protein
MKPILFLLAAAAFGATGCRAPDYTRNESNQCEVHHLAMTRRTVPIAYGMIPMSRVEAAQGEWHRRVTLYPHPGDCMPATDINLQRETRATVYVCARCEAAQKELRPQ